jgi:hypothetical protein
MEEERKKGNILVTLDTLFDTRLAFIYCLEPNSLNTVTEKNRYVTRLKDNFGSISHDIFYSMYRNRNKNILELATPTPIFGLLKEEYGDLVTNIKTQDDKGYIYLNTYPYQLNTIEKENIISVIKNIIPNANIKIVYMDKEELTPQWVDDNIGTIFDYFGLEWIEYNTSNTKLIRKPLLNTSIIIPSIINGVMQSSQIDKKIFEQMSSTASTLVDLIIIDTKYFSSVFGKEKK